MQGVKLLTWRDFVELGKSKPQDPHPPSEDDPACIMYTSGTTGLLSLSCLLHGCIAAWEDVTGYLRKQRSALTQLHTLPKDVSLQCHRADLMSVMHGD